MSYSFLELVSFEKLLLMFGHNAIVLNCCITDTDTLPRNNSRRISLSMIEKEILNGVRALPIPEKKFSINCD